jgi:hypothetical protein
VDIAQKKKEMNAGSEEARHVLIENGYNEEEIQQAIGQVYPDADPSSEGIPDVREKLGFFEKIIGVLFNPKSFFETIRQEKSYKPVIVYLVVISTVVIILQLIFLTVMGTIFDTSAHTGGVGVGYPMGGVPDMGDQLLMIGLCVMAMIPISLVFMLVVSFISAAIYHVVSMIFQSKEPFLETYKATVYGQTPGILFSVFANIPYLSCLSMIFSIWSIVLMVIGLKTLQRLSTGRAVATILIPTVLALVCIFATIFLLFASIIGEMRGGMGF